jgi:hypothetical protein
MEPAVRVELTTNGLQIRCSATELRRLKSKGELCEYRLGSQYVERPFFTPLSFLVMPQCN